MKMMRWLQNYPRFLEFAFTSTLKLTKAADPVFKRIGYGRIDKFIHWAEQWTKEQIFDCRMCGQCILHSTGMTCPMSCPKNLRNGPCGGVRLNGHCEVIPEMKCVWVQAFERSQQMGTYGHEILDIQPPVNRLLEGQSAWVTMLSGEDKNVPKAWVKMADIPVLEKESPIWN